MVGGLRRISIRGALQGICDTRHPSEDGAANPKASVPDPNVRALRSAPESYPKSHGEVVESRGFVSFRSSRTQSSKHEAMDDVVPLPSRPLWATICLGKWATARRFVTVRMRLLGD